MTRPAGQRPWYAPAVVGLLLLLLAGSLLAGVFATRSGTKHVDAAAGRADTIAACRSFEPVFDATSPGSPIDAQRLAGKLDSAISSIQRAASEDPMWKALATTFDEIGNAVNAGDPQRAAPALLVAHRSCVALTTGKGNA